jgi:hypothetical protein
MRMQCTEFGRPILAMEKVHGEMEPSRQPVTQALLQGEQFMYVPGFMTIRNECNMDPTSYSMTLLNATVGLGHHYILSFPELHSVQMVFHMPPNSCLFFGIASKILLHLDPTLLPVTHPTDYSFGYLLASIIIDPFPSDAQYRYTPNLSSIQLLHRTIGSKEGARGDNVR